MRKNEYTKTCGMIIREAREAKNMTIDDLVNALSDDRITAKLIKKWEMDKDFPDLNYCYKLAYVIDINPTELLVFRDRQRKAFIKRTNKPKKRLWISEEVKENIYYTAEAGIKLLVIFIAAFIVRGFAMTFDSAINGDVDKFTDTVVQTIDDNVNGIDNVTGNNAKNILKNDVTNEINNNIVTDNDRFNNNITNTDNNIDTNIDNNITNENGNI